MTKPMARPNLSPSIPILIVFFIFFILSAQVLSAETLLRSSIGGNIVSMSANGNTILVMYLNPDLKGNITEVTVYKRQGTSYDKIAIQGMEVYVPIFSQSVSNKNRPRLTDDGQYMYFIYCRTGLVTKGSLIKTSTKNPTIQLIDINNRACEGMYYHCKFAISGNRMAFYNYYSKWVTVVQQDQIVLFHASLGGLRYPYKQAYSIYYQCNYYNNQNPSYSWLSYSCQYRCLTGYCEIYYQQVNYQKFNNYNYIHSISLSKDGNILVLRGDFGTEMKFYYFLNFNGSNAFDLSTVRRDYEPEAFIEVGYSFWIGEDPQNYNNDGYISKTYKQLMLKTQQNTIKLRRLFYYLYSIEVSKDKRTTQGYSMSWNSSYILQLIQASSSMDSPDLRIIQQGPIGMFDMNSDGTEVAYLYDSTLVVIRQQLGVPEVVYPCYTAYLYFKNYEKCVNQKWVTYFSFIGVIFLLVFNIGIFGLVIGCYIKRRCKKDEEQQDQQDKASDHKKYETKKQPQKQTEMAPEHPTLMTLNPIDPPIQKQQIA